MFSSVKMRYCAVFLVVFIVLINVVSLDARRSWGGGHKSSSSSSRSRPSSSGWGKPKHDSAPKSPSMPQSSLPHTPHSSGSWNKKDSSNILIHSEGGGRPRPGTSATNDHKQQSSPHQPSAPNEPINRATSTNVQSQAIPHGSIPGGAFPSWANPAVGPQAGSYRNVPGSSQPHGGGAFPNAPSNPVNSKSTVPIASAPYHPTHPAGPISHQAMSPGAQPTHTMGAPQGSYPHPNSPHGVPAPYPPPSAPFSVGNPPGMPMPNAPHIGFGNVPHNGGVHQPLQPHQQHPIGSPHVYSPLGTSQGQPHPGGYPGGYPGAPHSTVIHNHYNSPPPGSHPYPAGHPNYPIQPPYGAAPMNQPFVPGHTTVFLPSQQTSSGPGIGQLVKEALVFSTVNAGVNRLINGAPHHHDHYQPSQSSAPASPSSVPSSSTSTVTNTVIYNNQYPSGNPNGSGVPSVPGDTSGSSGVASTATGSSGTSGTSSGINANSPFPGVPTNLGNNNRPGNPVADSNTGTFGNSGTSGYSNPPSSTTSGGAENKDGTKGSVARPVAGTNENAGNQTASPVFEYWISNEELWNLTEGLFKKDEYNASRFVTLNLQNRQTDANSEDVAPAQLLYVEREAYAIPTIKILREIYGNYKFNSTDKEPTTAETRRQENILLDTFLETSAMTSTMSWLSKKGYIEPDSFEWKDTLRHIWMTKVNGATSGFERIFMAEKYDGPSVIGAQNWVYIDDDQESTKRINYMGYVDTVYLGQKCHLIKINSKIDGVVKPNTTMLVGTSPELEMALYTICYYARPNDVCNVSLGGFKINIYTHAFRYYGKDLIDLGLMFFQD